MFIKRLLIPIRWMKTLPPQPPLQPRGLFKTGLDHAFGKYLLLTNTLTSGILMAIGDLVQQEIEYQNKHLPERYDYTRILNMTIVGLTQGPIHHYFYGWMYSILPNRDLMSIIKKICLDQFIMSPVCIVELFYLMNYLDGKPLKYSNDEVAEKFVEVYTMDWSVWPPAQFINFYFVPTKYQVVYINFVTMLYNVYLSYIKHRQEEIT